MNIHTHILTEDKLGRAEEDAEEEEKAQERK
jgi:hypothetical protein